MNKNYLAGTIFITKKTFSTKCKCKWMTLFLEEKNKEKVNVYLMPCAHDCGFLCSLKSDVFWKRIDISYDILFSPQII